MDAIPVLLVLIGILYVGKSVWDVIHHEGLSRRRKANFLFLIFLLPLVGSVIYHLYVLLMNKGSRT